VDALLGAIVGASLTAALGLLTERLRWRREAQVRHDEWKRADRLRIQEATRHAYVDFVEAVQGALGLHARLGVATVAREGVPEGIDPSLRQDTWDNNERLSNAGFRITLLAPVEVAAAVTQVQRRLYELSRVSVARDQANTVVDAILGVTSALSAFRQLVRADFDLPPDTGEMFVSSQ